MVKHISILLISFALLACGQNQEGQNAIYQNSPADQIVGGRQIREEAVPASGIVGLIIVKQLSRQGASLAKVQGGQVSNQNIATSICTGSIITEQLILTAAHCVFNDPGEKLLQVIAVFGGNMIKIAQDKELLKKVGRPVTALRISPLYKLKKDTPINNGDIAVLKFAGGLPPGFVTATFAPSLDAVKAGDRVILAGYGITGNKQVMGTNGQPMKGPDGEFLYEPIDKNSSGLLRYTVTKVIGGLTLNPSKQSIEMSQNTKTTEIAVDQKDGHGACQGDSGGPAYAYINGKKYLWGVTSRGDGSCRTYGIYTNALVYGAWIQKVSRELLALPNTSAVNTGSLRK